MIRSINPASDDSYRRGGLSRLPPNPGSSTDAWRLLRPIASTPSSEVALLQDAKGQLAVGKRLAPALKGHRSLIANEYAALMRFADPAVVRALGLTVRDSESWLLLEYLEYGDLRSLAGSPPAHWLALLLEPLRWLADLHAQGFVHGDIKASHVMLRHPKQACWIDLATVTARGRRLPTQTISASPPEGSALAAPSADVFSVGVMLHELLFATLPPFDGSVASPVPHDCPQLVMLSSACRAPAPTNRPTMQAVFDELKEICDRAALAAS